MLALHYIATLYGFEWQVISNVEIHRHGLHLAGSWHPLRHAMHFPIQSIAWHPHGHGLGYRLFDVHWGPRHPC